MTTPTEPEPTIITTWRDHLAGTSLIPTVAIQPAYSLLVYTVMLDVEFQQARLIFEWDLSEYFFVDESRIRLAERLLGLYDAAKAIDTLEDTYDAYVTLFEKLMGI